MLETIPLVADVAALISFLQDGALAIVGAEPNQALRTVLFASPPREHPAQAARTAKVSP